MEFRTAHTGDLDAIMKIVGEAKESLRSRGIDQWQRGYPNLAVIEQDIDRGTGRVVCEGGVIATYGSLIFDGEPAYRSIKGSWLTDEPYAVVHRLCTSSAFAGRGFATAFMNYAAAEAKRRGYGSFRIDTHPQNTHMRTMLSTIGFACCGDVVIESRRMAYEKILR